MLEWARQILADVGSLEAEVDAMHGGLSGQLRIGAIPTSLPCVSLLTTPLLRRHPGVTVAVYSLNSTQIERGLDEFELELGVTYLDSEPLRGVRTLPLYREHYVLLTEAAGPFGDRKEVTWAEAATLPLCLLTGDMQNRRIVDGIFHEAGAEPRPQVETNSISTLIAHVRDGPVVERDGPRLAARLRPAARDAGDPARPAGDDAHDRARLARSRSRADAGAGAPRRRRQRELDARRVRLSLTLAVIRSGRV